MTSYLNYTSPSSPAAQHLLTTWPAQFESLLEARAPLTFARWKVETDLEAVLGKEGQALSDVREFLRSCVEVGVRGWGNVEKGKGEWRDVVQDRLRVLGCL